MPRYPNLAVHKKSSTERMISSMWVPLYARGADPASDKWQPSPSVRYDAGHAGARSTDAETDRRPEWQSRVQFEAEQDRGRSPTACSHGAGLLGVVEMVLSGCRWGLALRIFELLTTDEPGVHIEAKHTVPLALREGTTSRFPAPY